MNTERKELLEKIDKLIHNKREILLTNYPDVHEIDDGIVVRFFTQWDNCNDNAEIKFKKIEADNPDESIIFWYLPKDSAFELKQRYFIGCMVCLSGKIEIEVEGEISFLKSYQKKCLNSENVDAKIHENTYLVTISNKNVWSKTTQEHVAEYE